ncbi:MAG TPA: gamma carbonic anhydrase family protein [Myxococcales bacterium]|nr:gamma carbonic anhydrase family protein [Myxococcales bacterium]
MLIRTVNGRTPRLGREVFVAPTATLAGDVVLGDRASIWYGCVVRSEEQRIEIGEETNIQDLSVIHVTNRRFGTRIGARVTVGHRVVLHACTISDLCLIGIGAIVLDQAVIGSETIVAAGSVVTPGTQIPPRVLAVGSPARVKRPLTDQELEHIRWNAADYVKLAGMHGRGA